MVAFRFRISTTTFYFGKSGVGKLERKIVLPARHFENFYKNITRSEETKITCNKSIALFLLGNVHEFYLHTHVHVFPAVLTSPALRSSNNCPTGNKNYTVIISEIHRSV